MFSIILVQIIKMFFLMILGFIAFRTHLVDHEGSRTLSNLLLYLVNPLIILNAFQIDYSEQVARNLLIAFGISLIIHVIGILAGYLLIRPNPNSRIERYMIIYSNCAFIGIPLVSSILGQEGVLYVTSYIIIFNILMWTHGIILLSGHTSLSDVVKGLMTPSILAVLAGIVMFLLRLRFPPILADTIQMMTNMNAPLGMMIAGIALAESDLLKTLGNRSLYKISLVKLAVIPLLTLTICRFLPIPNTLLISMLICAACPCGATGIMLSIRYHQNYHYASALFTLTTLLSMATIPLIILISDHVL